MFFTKREGFSSHFRLAEICRIRVRFKEKSYFYRKQFIMYSKFKIKVILLWIALFFQISFLLAQNKNYVVVLSLDGFRWDYPELAQTPNLDSIAGVGVKADALIPSFPSLTFPNHYTLATGLYPDHHGLVLNHFHAPDVDGEYRLNNNSSIGDAKYYGGEPIWVSAEKQGVRTAVYFWVGSEAPVQGIYPGIWKKYDHHFPYNQRIDSVISWLQLPYSKRPHLIMWYIDQPDEIAHSQGPTSTATLKKVEYLDSLLGVFTHRMNELEIADSINFIILSDHGMCQLSADKHIDLKKHIPKRMIEYIDGSNPVYNIKVKSQFRQKVLDRLGQIDPIRFWEHGKLPEHLHYGHHIRTADITVVADSAWTLSWGSEYNLLGAHGYDPENKSMHAIFYAAGPDFKKAYQAPAFQNIHVYSILACLLGIEPAKTDGSIDMVNEMLVPH